MHMLHRFARVRSARQLQRAMPSCWVSAMTAMIFSAAGFRREILAAIRTVRPTGGGRRTAGKTKKKRNIKTARKLVADDVKIS
jgi:hypothetical protein